MREQQMQQICAAMEVLVYMAEEVTIPICRQLQIHLN